MNTSKQCRTEHNECIMLAPSQIANAFGPFDRMGMLGSRPPFSPEERMGGPGNWISVRRLPGKAGTMTLTLDVRECDEQGFWQPPKTFDKLWSEINARPEKDLARILARHTLRHIRKRTGKPIRDGFDIHIVIHTPNGKTGLGLGGSASSSAVVMAIDALYGYPIAGSPDGEIAILRLMGLGEKIAAGRVFYDNVAPLAVKAETVYLRQPAPGTRDIEVARLTCPRNLHMVTITPDYAVSTEDATKILKGKTIGVFEAEAAASRYMDIRHAFDTGDLDLLIRSAGNRIVEPYRGQLVHGLDTVREVVAELNASCDRRRPRFACGISGSGPTMYILAGSHADADRAGFEAHRALRDRGIFSWWFCHRPNPNGAEVIELH